jgi:hypothetical protein
MRTTGCAARATQTRLLLQMELFLTIKFNLLITHHEWVVLTILRAGDWASILCTDKFFFKLCTEQHCDPPGLLSSWYKGLFPRVTLTTHLQVVLGSRKYGSVHPLPHTPSWRSASLIKYRDNFTLPYRIVRQIQGYGNFQLISWSIVLLVKKIVTHFIWNTPIFIEHEVIYLL